MAFDDSLFSLICWLHVPLLLDDSLFMTLSVAAHKHPYRSDDNNDCVILGAYNSPHGCCLLPRPITTGLPGMYFSKSTTHFLAWPSFKTLNSTGHSQCEYKTGHSLSTTQLLQVKYHRIIHSRNPGGSP